MSTDHASTLRRIAEDYDHAGGHPLDDIDADLQVIYSIDRRAGRVTAIAMRAGLLDDLLPDDPALVPQAIAWLDGDAGPDRVAVDPDRDGRRGPSAAAVFEAIAEQLLDRDGQLGQDLWLAAHVSPANWRDGTLNERGVELIRAERRAELRRKADACRLITDAIEARQRAAVRTNATRDWALEQLRNRRRFNSIDARAAEPQERDEPLSDAEQAVLDSLTGQPQRQIDLATESGYSEKTVGQCLKTLVERGLAGRKGERGGYFLVAE